jgi:alginate O-acetyltransferase complex protein AlgJ
MAFPAAMPPVPPDDNSPVILLGDSHTIVFSEAGGTIKNHTTGSGLRDHLQVRLGTPLAVIATAASGADGARGLLARKAASTPTPNFWNNRKLVVWCFSAREFTQGRWRAIPAQPGRF